MGAIIGPKRNMAESYPATLTRTTDAAELGAGAEGRTAIISLPGWSFLDWSEETLDKLPHLSRLIREGAIGAMNIRTPEKGVEDGYATLGAGAPAFSSSGYMARNAGETETDRTGAEQYRRWTGRDPGEADVVVPGIGAIRRRNDNHSQQARPGLLGELLRRAGIATAVFGNGDTPPERRRYAALLVMDEAGRVPIGNVGESLLVPDPQAPYSVRTDANGMLRAWESSPPHSVTVLEWGDLLRLQSEIAMYDAAQAERMRLDALRRLDNFISGIASLRRSGDSVWLLSPFVGKEASRSRLLLAPIVYAGPAAKSPGLLVSPSTRREGIVTAPDFAPSVLAAYGIQAPPDMSGRAIQMTAHPDSVSFLRKEVQTIRDIYRARPRLLLPFVSVEAAVMLAALVAVWGKFRKAMPFIETLLLALLTAPFTLLCIGWLNAVKPLALAGQAALFVTATALLACLCVYRRSAMAAAVGMSAITAAALLVDGLFGAEGMKRSVLGYDPMIGARYYGMGNEYMGVLVGAVAFAVAAVAERRRPGPAAAAVEAPAVATAAAALAGAAKSPPPATPSRAATYARRRRAASLTATLAAAAFAAALLYLAAPQLGTNAGGAITAAVAFGLAWLRCFAGDVFRRLGPLRLALVCAVLVAAALAALWLLNAAVPAAAGRQSHIGRAMAWLGDGRTDLIAAMIVRKLRMNAHLIGVSVWTKVLAAALLVMAAAVLRPKGAFRRWEKRYPQLMSGFIAIAVGSLAALAFNDSGIVAAATMIVYAAVPMLLLRIQEDKSSHCA